MMNESCSDNYKSMTDQLAKHSPEARNNLTPAEHDIAHKLASDVQSMMQPIGKSAVQWMDQFQAAQKDAQGLAAGIKDRSQLDGILADANKILSKDDAKLLQTRDGLIAGTKDAGTNKWNPMPIDNIQCDPNLGANQFQIIDRYNKDYQIKSLDRK